MSRPEHERPFLQCLVLSTLLLGSQAAQPRVRRVLIDNGLAFTGGFSNDDGSTPALSPAEPAAVPISPTALPQAPSASPSVSAASPPIPAASAPSPLSSRLQAAAMAHSPVMPSIPPWVRQFPSSVYASLNTAAVSIGNASATPAATGPSSLVASSAPAPLQPFRLPPQGVAPAAFMRANATPAINASFALGG